MLTYPLTPSQVSAASVTDVLTVLKSPTLLARRLGEILDAQQFLGNFLLSGRFAVQGGAVAVPVNEKIRTVRGAETVAPGAEYKLTPIERGAWELYLAMKDGIATEVTDEEVGRSIAQPLDDALLFLQTELVFSANELALGAVQSAVTRTLAASNTWTNGKSIYRDALRVQAVTRKLKLGYNIDTAVLNGEHYAEVIPELLDVLPKDTTIALTDGFPTIGGITWIASDDDGFSDPMFADRRRLGGIARENIPSEEYRPVGNDTGVEIMRSRPGGDKTQLTARNPHVAVVTNPLAGVHLTGTGA